jgi:transaldolase
MTRALDLGVKLFADGADLQEMIALSRQPHIRGFTTNPTLMRKAGVRNYRQFARDVLAAIPNRPISFEVFSDEFDGMAAQAREIASWGPCVYVKIPITNTRGEASYDLIHDLSHAGVKVNVTAVLTREQISGAFAALRGGTAATVSVFAGRIADTGRDPVPIVEDAVARTRTAPGTEIIWASPRELLNIFQADAAGCHIITATADILRRLEWVGRDLAELSLDTVKMFRADAVAAAFDLSPEIERV